MAIWDNSNCRRKKNDSTRRRRRKEHLVKVSQELKAGWVLINEICTALSMFMTLHACHTNSLALTRNRNLRDAIKFVVVRWKLKKKFSNALTCFVVVVARRCRVTNHINLFLHTEKCFKLDGLYLWKVRAFAVGGN